MEFTGAQPNWLRLPLLTAAVLTLLFPWGALLGAEISTKPLVLSQGGTAAEPAVFDGQGLVIDLARDVTDQPWQHDGDLWTHRGPLLDRANNEAGQVAGLILDDVPLSIPRDLAAEKLHPDRKGKCYVAPAALKPGEMGYAEDDSIYFRWPAGKDPGQTHILLPPDPGTSCVTIACSYITVKNVTAKHAANDGFNIHGKWVGIRLENIRAIANADEGISAHDDVQMDVVHAEIAWNGSAAGGVADVNRTRTAYRYCTVHDNLAAAFYFSGQGHRVSDTLIYNQAKDFSVVRGTPFVQEHIERR